MWIKKRVRGDWFTLNEEDLRAIERDCRAGLLSLSEMSEAHGVSQEMISRRANALGWGCIMSANGYD